MYSKQLADQWKELIIGQDHAIDKIVPYIVRYKAGLAAPSHPIGNFFLLGPTGTGKTRTAETLAEVLHNDEKKVLRIDCGEYHLEHETAKLIGCFVPGTPILMGDGSRSPIEEISVGNGVISKDGQFKYVQDVYEYGYEGDL